MWTRLCQSWNLVSSQVHHFQKAFPKRLNHSHVGVVSAPFNKGQRREGVKNGPNVIKETGVLDRLQDLGVKVVDYGAVSMSDVEDSEVQLGPDGERHHTTVLTYCRKLASMVSSVIRKDGLCLTLGGDHALAIGSINGHAQANPDHQVVVLWVDAHADINTGSVSPSGNMHGMPVAHHLKELADKINRLPDGWPQPCLSADNIAFIGLRDVDACEREYLKKFGILAFDVKDIDRLGVAEVISKCLKALSPGDSRPLHLSFDIDALDPLEAPSTGTPVRAGLTLREGLTIVESVRETGFLGAMDLVEVNPSLGSEADAALTTEAAKTILLGALAGHRGT